MKHAYLILAHHEFELLQILLSTLDDSRNDIYVHFDKKLLQIPTLHVEHAKLILVQERIDVSWGDVSVVEAEYALFEAAHSHGDYTYYHLLSGVDLPLQRQDDIHHFFNLHHGKEFIGYSQYDTRAEIDRKVNRYHLFPKDFRYTGTAISMAKKVIRALFLRLQYLSRWRRNTNIDFRKGTQWVSISQDFVTYILTKKREVLSLYQHTFCSDEIFIQTLCWNSNFRSQIFNMEDEAIGSQRDICWRDGVLYDWKDTDMDRIQQSRLLFARKFNSNNKQIVYFLKQKNS
jgi:hypothetical protein